MNNGADPIKVVALYAAVEFLGSDEPVSDDAIVEQAQQVIFSAVMFEAYLRGQSKGETKVETSAETA